MQALSLADIYTTSRHYDFSEARDTETGESGYTVQYPTPSADDLDEYWPEWREECDGDDDEEKLAEARDTFDAADRFHEWQDAHEPMMNFLWPLDLPYGTGAETIATALHEAGIAVTLVEVTDEADPWGRDAYAFALTGGGMNLAWHIASAYVLAGAVPPFQLMEDLPRPCDVSDDLRDQIVAAATRAQEAMKNRADRMAEAVARAAAYKHGE